MAKKTKKASAKTRRRGDDKRRERRRKSLKQVWALVITFLEANRHIDLQEVAEEADLTLVTVQKVLGIIRTHPFYEPQYRTIFNLADTCGIDLIGTPRNSDPPVKVRADRALAAKEKAQAREEEADRKRRRKK